MLSIVVCMKQVPETTDVEIDSEKGTLKREGVDSKTNLYDLYALELAIDLKEKHGGTVTVISMGPPQSKAVIAEAYALGADRGILLSDRRFAGADTLATAYTLSRAIMQLNPPDLILSGMQTSDGDTAQVGPALAEMLGIEHVAYVKEVAGMTNDSPPRLAVRADMGDAEVAMQIALPCLLTCTKEVAFPRLPSYLLKMESRDKPVDVWTYDDLKPESGPEYFGLDGSPTRVEKIFPPTFSRQQAVWEGPARETAGKMLAKLKEMKVI